MLGSRWKPASLLFSPVAPFMSTLPCLQGYNSSMPVPKSNTLGLVSSGTAVFACVAAAVQPLVTLSTRWTHLGLFSSCSHHVISLQNCSTAANNIWLSEAASPGSTDMFLTSTCSNKAMLPCGCMGVGICAFQADETIIC